MLEQKNRKELTEKLEVFRSVLWKFFRHDHVLTDQVLKLFKRQLQINFYANIIFVGAKCAISHGGKKTEFLRQSLIPADLKGKYEIFKIGRENG